MLNPRPAGPSTEDWGEPEVLVVTFDEDLEPGAPIRLELVQGGGNRTLGSFRLGLAPRLDPESTLVPATAQASRALDLQTRLRPRVPTTPVLAERTTPG